MSRDTLGTLSIDRRRLLQSAGLGALASGVPAGSALAKNPAALDLSVTTGDLERLFRDPPPEARPGVFWYWMNGIVTREGIAADLAAMAEAGFGRVILFSIGIGTTPAGMKQYASLTPEWWDMFGYAIEAAGRVGIEITVGACDGWATAAGPWIEPELSMQRVTWNAVRLAGGTRFASRLPQPFTAMDYYRDIRTVAFPMPKGWATSVERKPKVTTSFGIADPARLNSHALDADTAIDTSRAGWIEYAFDAPFTVRGVEAFGPDGGAGAGLLLEASNDGQIFRPVGKLAQADETTLAQRDGFAPGGTPAEPVYVIDGAPETTARVFRIGFTPGKPGDKRPAQHFAGPNGDPVVFPAPEQLRLSRLVLTDEPGVPDLTARSARTWSLPPRDLGAGDLPHCIPAGDIVDLTGHVGADGSLDWTPPRHGIWKIVRIGHTCNGAINGTGFSAGRGLECDKMNPAAARLQFDSWLGQLPRRVDKARVGHALTTMHTDSWECGSQNWSATFSAEFAKRRGYDLLPLVAVMAGVPIDGADTVNGVLADVRRTIAEATCDNFFGEMARLGRQAGYEYSSEPSNPIYPTDPLIIAKHADRPMGEFWVFGDDKPSDIADAIHGGHVYGRRVIGAESFTEFAMQWTETPYSCKPLGDANWAKGVNQLTCHVWAAQPWTDAKHEPGMTLANIGVFFSRTNTWFAMAKPWFDYIRRGQALLQQGRPVVDVAYYLGEDIPARAFVPGNTPTPVPDGYKFDSINPDALLNLAQVKDGRIVLPNGQRYALLLLPASYRATVPVLRRIDALARAGAIIVGPAPRGRMGLEGGKQGLNDYEALTSALWSGDGRLRPHGAGMIGTTDDVAGLLRQCGLVPDCIVVSPVPAPGTASPFMWTHREGPDWDLYFVSNQSADAHRAALRLRASGAVAELWNADTGTVGRATATRTGGGSTIEVDLDPCGSAFVLLRKDASAGAAPIGKATGAAIALDQRWRVTFARGLAAPKTISMSNLESWALSQDTDIRHYSGTAAYETRFRAPEGAGWCLDLGDVAEVCEVELNGKLLRRLWKPPYRVDLGAAIKPGENRLVVLVANTWRNRLVGDAALPEESRSSFTVTPFFTGKPTPGLPLDPDIDAPTTDANGLFLGGGFGNDAHDVPLRGSPAGTPPPHLKGLSRYGFPGGGSSAPGPDMRRRPGADKLVPAGLLGPVRLIRMETV